MPTTALETGLYNKLKASSALITALGGTLIYNKIAPQGTTGKYVIFQWQGGGDENDTPTRSRNPVYTVFGIDNTVEGAAALDGLIDTALHEATLTVSGWNNYHTVRESDINIMEPNTGKTPVFRCGGLYRIMIDK